MSKKFLINIMGRDSSVGFNAVVKPRKDIEKTLLRNGYRIINIPYITDYSSWKRLSLHFYQLIKTVCKMIVEKPDDIIIQYPGMRVGSKAISFIVKLLRNQNVTLLIHDIDSLRINGEISKREVSTFNCVKKIITHTDNMTHYLQEHGVSTEMNPIWIFDYYAKVDTKETLIDNIKSVIFAGNLNKSTFLQNINLSLDDTTLYLYGLPVNFSLSAGVEYKGKFAPDEISNIEGAWGLVWDGDSVNTCSGNMGNYIKYNSSHKAALYIAAGKPVIIWNQSGIAPFIIKNNLGISISSLQELPLKLSKISNTEYKEYLKSVSIFQNKLLNGKMLEDVLLK